MIINCKNHRKNNFVFNKHSSVNFEQTDWKNGTTDYRKIEIQEEKDTKIVTGLIKITGEIYIQKKVKEYL